MDLSLKRGAAALPVASLAVLLVLAACNGDQPESTREPQPTQVPEAAATVAPPPAAAAATEAAPAPAAASVDTPTPVVTPMPAPERVSAEARVPDYRRGFFVVVDNPLLISASASTLGDDDLVLGYEQDGVARAYPVGMVSFHHVINDTVQGRPLLVTF